MGEDGIYDRSFFMKKVLIIGHFWPYRGGSKRIIGLAKYLKDFGWEPIVLTGVIKQKPDYCRVVEISYCGFLGKWGKLLGINPESNVSDQLKEKIDRRKSYSIFRGLMRFIYRRVAEIFAYPDEDKYFERPAVEAAGRLIEKEKIDAIISVWPVTSHLIARELKDRYNIPWVADFPDLWSQNYHYPYNFIRKYFDRKLEKGTLSKCDAITTVSLPLKDVLKKIHKKNIFDITLGFDPESRMSASRITEKFTITYTGLVYRDKQDVTKIFSALKDLIKKKIIDPKDIEIRFYGPKDHLVEKSIKTYGLSSVAKQYGAIVKDESLGKQRESQLLLFLNWEDKNQKGVYTGKIFEYLAAGRPIISTGGFKEDVIEDLIKKTNAGVFAKTTEDVRHELEKYYLNYKQKGAVDYLGNKEEINKYSHIEMARKFKDILEKL